MVPVMGKKDWEKEYKKSIMLFVLVYTAMMSEETKGFLL